MNPCRIIWRASVRVESPALVLHFDSHSRGVSILTGQTHDERRTSMLHGIETSLNKSDTDGFDAIAGHSQGFPEGLNRFGRHQFDVRHGGKVQHHLHHMVTTVAERW